MRQLFLILSLSLAVTACTREKQLDRAPSDQPPDIPMPATVPLPDFDGIRSFDFLKAQVAFGPRNPNSLGHNRCKEYLVSELRRTADEVRLQDFSHTGYGGEKLFLTNIIASFSPSTTDRILLCAHWDTRPRADHDENKDRRDEPILGANDGASGVAVLLELASILKAKPAPTGVDIVLFDGEDYGEEGDTRNYLLGSRHFARTKDPGYVPRFGILLDMVGDKYLEIPKEGYSVKYAPDVVDLVWNTARQLGYQQFLDAAGQEVIDDHLPLNEAGIKAIDIIDFDYPDPTNRFWHTHQDIPANCSAESLEAVGSVVTYVIYSQSR